MALLIIVLFICIVVVAYCMITAADATFAFISGASLSLVIGGGVVLLTTGIMQESLPRKSATYDVASIITVGDQHEVTTTDGKKFIVGESEYDEVKIGDKDRITVFEKSDSVLLFDWIGEHEKVVLTPTSGK